MEISSRSGGLGMLHQACDRGWRALLYGLQPQALANRPDLSLCGAPTRNSRRNNVFQSSVRRLPGLTKSNSRA